MPYISVFVNSKEVLNNSTINLEVNQSYTLSCLALNSKPSVYLSIYDQETNSDIELVNFVSILKSLKTQSCDEKGFCNSSLTNLIFLSKDNNRQYIKLACRAENNTSPFAISTEIDFTVNLTEMG